MARDNIERFRGNQRRMRATPDFKRRSRAGHPQRKYGMSLDDYEALLAEQDGVCGICGKIPVEGSPLHIDHDHATGHVRGLLCFRCNNSLGDFDDDPSLLSAALEYVGRSTPREPQLEARIAELKARRAG